MKDKEKQIEEMAKIMCSPCPDGKECSGTWCYKRVLDCANEFYEQGYRKLPEDSVVLSSEEYEEYQSYKNGDYCATKCDIHELSFNQMNKINDLENENEKLKKEIKNPNEVLEDRERFKARNEELKGITEQLRQEIIILSQELVNSRKETAEKILKALTTVLHDNRQYGNNFVVVYMSDIQELAKQFGVEIKE